MAVDEQLMDLDPPPDAPKHKSRLSSILDWDLLVPGFPGSHSASSRQVVFLDSIRQVVREEISPLVQHGPKEQQRKPSGPDPEIKILELQDQVHRFQEESGQLHSHINHLREQVDQARKAISEGDARNKALQRVIIEKSQTITPPMDDDIVISFNQLNYDIKSIVKIHFKKPFMSEEPIKTPWRDYETLTEENKELSVRAYIADQLKATFFATKIFGLDDEQEIGLREFESKLEDSPKLKDPDIVDWRIQTVSCAQKLGYPNTVSRSRKLAIRIVTDLWRMGPKVPSEEYNRAVENMATICKKALTIALLFRSNRIFYFWLQRQAASSIPRSDREIIGSTNTRDSAEQCSPRKIVFGGVIKNSRSKEDRVVLTKSEVLVG